MDVCELRVCRIHCCVPPISPNVLLLLSFCLKTTKIISPNIFAYLLCLNQIRNHDALTHTHTHTLGHYARAARAHTRISATSMIYTCTNEKANKIYSNIIEAIVLAFSILHQKRTQRAECENARRRQRRRRPMTRQRASKRGACGCVCVCMCRCAHLPVCVRWAQSAIIVTIDLTSKCGIVFPFYFFFAASIFFLVVVVVFFHRFRYNRIDHILYFDVVCVCVCVLPHVTNQNRSIEMTRRSDGGGRLKRLQQPYKHIR